MARIIPPRVNNSRPLGSVRPGMLISYRNQLFTIISLAHSEMTDKGLRVTFKVKEAPYKLQALSSVCVNLIKQGCY